MRSLISREALRVTSLRLLIPRGPTLPLLAFRYRSLKISSQFYLCLVIFLGSNSIIPPIILLKSRNLRDYIYFVMRLTR